MTLLSLLNSTASPQALLSEPVSAQMLHISTTLIPAMPFDDFDFGIPLVDFDAFSSHGIIDYSCSAESENRRREGACGQGWSQKQPRLWVDSKWLGSAFEEALLAMKCPLKRLRPLEE